MACPFRCIYCNQFSITGNCDTPEPDQVKETIDIHLETILKLGGRVEVAFFGGSFTGLTIEDQNRLLSIVEPYLDKNLVHGIRISTRPDYISETILENLKQHRVVAIELGAQSLDDDVLKLSGRGHTKDTISSAANKIKSKGFELGLQMMTGLPGDTYEKSIATANAIIGLGADTTRIYPTLVLKETPLAQLYYSGRYKPQGEEEAIDLCAILYENFISAQVKVLRMGLHPSDGFISGETLIDGPFHPAFGELVMTRVWRNRFKPLMQDPVSANLSLKVNPGDLNAAIGHKSTNKIELKKYYRHVIFKPDMLIKKGLYNVDIY